MGKRLSIFSSQRDNYVPAFKIYTRRASSSKFLAKFSRFMNKFLYKVGIGSSLNRYDNSLTFYSAKSDSRLYQEYGKEEVFCNFGSGAFYHRRWKNYDYPGQSVYYKSLQGVDGADFIGIDLCDQNLIIPEDSETVSLIYCSHTLEHLESESALKFLKECSRILKSGGVMRLALPNTTNDFRILKLVHAQDIVPEQWKEDLLRDAVRHILPETFQSLSVPDIYELAKDVNFSAEEFYKEAVGRGVDVRFSGTNPEKHISFWSYESLVPIATALGFRFAIPCYQGSSVAGPFRNVSVFDTTEPHISFYIELIK